MSFKMLTIFSSLIVSSMHAQQSFGAESACVARCVVLQIGAEAEFKIGMRLRSYSSHTLLLTDLGEITAPSYEGLKSECAQRAGEHSRAEWFRPGSYDLTAIKLAKNILVDNSDDVRAVIDFRELTACADRR